MADFELQNLDTVLSRLETWGHRVVAAADEAVVEAASEGADLVQWLASLGTKWLGGAPAGSARRAKRLSRRGRSTTSIRVAAVSRDSGAVMRKKAARVTPLEPSRGRHTGAGPGRPTTKKRFALRAFQKRFMAQVLSPDIRRAVLSLPRGSGKSTLAGYICTLALRPRGALFRAGDENVLLSGSFDQARYVYRAAKSMLGSKGYRYQDNKQRLEITHELSGTKLVVKSSRAKTAFGIVGARLAIADEPGAWDTVERRAHGRRTRHGDR